MTRIHVFINDFPVELESWIRSEKEITITRDGMQPYGATSLPRLTILMSNRLTPADKEKELKLLNLLTELQANGKIISFKVC